MTSDNNNIQPLFIFFSQKTNTIELCFFENDPLLDDSSLLADK